MDKHERAESVLRLDEWALSKILPVYNEATKSYTPTVDDPIIVSIDFETLCRFAQGTYPESHWMRGTPYDYNPITEIGWTIFDTRELAKKTTPPGDSAFSLPNVKLFDVQKHQFIREAFGHNPACYKVMNRLGLRYMDARAQLPGDKHEGGHNIIHNVGNDTVFQMQILLTLQYMDAKLIE
ncbi:hypothetical protein ACLX1H_009999 [Fusarium chlamydosporum]